MKLLLASLLTSVLILKTQDHLLCGECLSSRLVYKFFRINNIELKGSFVRCQKYHKL